MGVAVTNAEVVAALFDVAARVDDLDWMPRILLAQNMFVAGCYNQASDQFNEVVWAAYLGGGPMDEEVRDIGSEMQLRRTPAHPVNFEPPHHYGHLRG
jgi:hypothetical protein